MATVRGNLERIRDRIATACDRAARPPEAVRLVGVTKSVDPGRARELVMAGCGDLAESRPQQLWARAASLADLGDRLRWHLVGHLQRNKVQRTLPVCHLIHSLDSPRLLDSLGREARSADCTARVLIEVDLTGSAARTGLPPEAVEPLLAGWPADGSVVACGLMGMASAPEPGAPAGRARRQFAALRELRDRLRPIVPGLTELSMGMSDDFEDAILEGATIVRIGSALWEGLGPAT